jgi:hypothetical protein
MKTENFEARSTDPVTEQSKRNKGQEKSQSYKALTIRGIVQDAERKLKTKRRKNKTKAEKRKTLTTLSVNKLMATSVVHSLHRHHSNNRLKKNTHSGEDLEKRVKHIYGPSPALFLLPPPTSHSQINSCWLAGFPNPHVIIMLWRSMQEERRSNLRERKI